jgi:hypothetical protein
LGSGCMKIVHAPGCWTLVDNAGDVIAQRTCLKELQAHWDGLSAVPKEGDEHRGGTRLARPSPPANHLWREYPKQASVERKDTNRPMDRPFIAGSVSVGRLAG